ncbi:hypothetical protein HYALB_00005727 [Hymenoscyphus albidus]|uniref:Uncharacterized protein n=1 Tax=Hymenoscyphus albidus TaxID=595503 RepID=A0A9N9Q764_9HELO|nr:hypothetical protein HYALB_00005727 [Hymenoscyphus albidus]
MPVTTRNTGTRKLATRGAKQKATTEKIPTPETSTKPRESVPTGSKRNAKPGMSTPTPAIKTEPQESVAKGSKLEAATAKSPNLTTKTKLQEPVATGSKRAKQRRKSNPLGIITPDWLRRMESEFPVCIKEASQNALRVLVYELWLLSRRDYPEIRDRIHHRLSKRTYEVSDHDFAENDFTWLTFDQRSTRFEQERFDMLVRVFQDDYRKYTSTDDDTDFDDDPDSGEQLPAKRRRVEDPGKESSRPVGRGGGVKTDFVDESSSDKDAEEGSEKSNDDEESNSEGSEQDEDSDEEREAFDRWYSMSW